MKSFLSLRLLAFLLGLPILSLVGAASSEDDLTSISRDFEKEMAADLEAGMPAKEIDKKKTKITEVEDNPQNLDLNSDQILRGEKLKESRIRFRGERNSIIDWTGSDGESLLDYKKWKQATLAQEKNKNYDVISRAKSHREIIARVLSCYGNCMAEREAKEYSIQRKSRITEGDEVFTEKDSYLWLALSSGEVMRLAPESSVLFREINYSEREIFYFLRVNRGFVKLAKRMSELTKDPRHSSFTDPLALPLYPDLSISPVPQKLKDKLNYENELEQKLTGLQKTNNLWRNKINSHFLVSLPNGVISFTDMSIDLFTNTLAKSYFKTLEGKEFTSANFYYLDDKKEEKPINDQWYELSYDGKSLIKLQEFKQAIYDGEVFFKNIVPLRLSSEMLMSLNLSGAYNQNKKPKEIAEEFGVFRWDLFLSKDDFEKRSKDLKAWALYLEKGNRDKSIQNLSQKNKSIEKETLQSDIHVRAFKAMELK